jgi:hypothetical protein
MIIISKTEGPRREDARMRHVLSENRETIQQIKKAISGSQSSVPTIDSPSLEVTRSFGYRATAGQAVTSPYISLSHNGRVVVVDYETGRQLHHLGDIRGPRRSQRFVLASAKNSYYVPVDERIGNCLIELDGTPVHDKQTEEALKAEIALRLGFRA